MFVNGNWYKFWKISILLNSILPIEKYRKKYISAENEENGKNVFS